MKASVSPLRTEVELRLLEACFEQHLCTPESLQKIETWRYYKLAKLLECDPAFFQTKQTVKLLEIGAKQFIRSLDSDVQPLWFTQQPRETQLKLKNLVREIRAFLDIKHIDENVYTANAVSSSEKSDSKSPRKKVRKRSSVPPPRTTLDLFFQESRSSAGPARADPRIHQVVILSCTSGGQSDEFATSVSQLYAAIQAKTPFMWKLCTNPKREFAHTDLDRPKKEQLPLNVLQPWHSSCPSVEPIVLFVKSPAKLHTISLLVASDDQERPTLKILYCLASQKYIVRTSFLHKSLQGGLWEIPMDHEHPLWPSLELRQRLPRSSLLQNVQFSVLGTSDKMRSTDVIQLMQFLGATYTQRLNKDTVDVVIVLDQIASHDESVIRTSLTTESLFRSASPNQLFVLYRQDSSDASEEPQPDLYFVTPQWMVDTISQFKIQSPRVHEHITAKLCRSDPTTLVGPTTIATRRQCRMSLSEPNQTSKRQKRRSILSEKETFSRQGGGRQELPFPGSNPVNLHRDQVPSTKQDTSNQLYKTPDLLHPNLHRASMS